VAFWLGLRDIISRVRKKYQCMNDILLVVEDLGDGAVKLDFGLL
jgi:hypothetical protein